METPSAEEMKRMPEWSIYARTFCRLMSELGGWTQEQAETHLQNRLRDPGFRGWFPYDPPSDEAAPLLLPEDLRGAVEGVAWVRLRERICEAIDCSAEDHNPNPDNNPDYVWEAARQRVTQAIDQFRTSQSRQPEKGRR